MGSITVLYTLCQGLNILLTALMALRAQAIGGLHLHTMFKLPTSDGVVIAPYAAANTAMEEIRRKTDLQHALLTVDVMFLDEAGHVSSEQLAIIDNILQKIRGSQIPFAGVTIICTMDQWQLQPIDALPFRVSSFMLTSFVAVELKHSSRAHGHPKYKRLQDTTRMDPHVLRESSELINKFKNLAKEILVFVADWDDEAIGPNMMRAFSRRIPAQEALNQYHESITQKLDRSQTQ